jgi:cytosine/adenosine deaminase-related metal-dependent hydrolase
MVLGVFSGCSGDDDPVDPDVDSDSDVDSDVDSDSDTGPAGPANIELCEVLPPVAEGLCEVEPGVTPGVVIRGTVLGADDAYVGGSVVVGADGRITCVGCDCALPDGVSVATCGDAVVSPGLIDPHDHLTFGDRAPLDLGDRRWDHRHGWRGSLSTPSNLYGTGATSDGMQLGEIRKLLGGTTSLVGSGYAAGLVRNLDRSAGRESDALPVVDNETFPLGDSDRRYRADCGWDYSVDAWEASLEQAYVPHVAEGIDDYAADEFLCLSNDMVGGQDVTEANAAHVHGIGLTTQDYDQMARSGTALIWSARSNLQLYGETARVTVLANLGGTIALGSDWTYSGSIHPGRELACADRFNTDHLDGFFSARELWRMSTRNAAIALRADADIGTLEVGKLADIAVFSPPADPDLPWRAPIEAGATDVALVLREGKPLYGEAALLEGLGSSCEALDVCGAARALCTQGEIDTDFAGLVSRTPQAYPAFFCDGPPVGEPVCAPVRPGRWPGVAVDGDRDGDGVSDEVDLCPTVFDPIRPIDDGMQLDADDDGVGDACDPDPLPVDLDNDGFDSAVDNCPYLANPDQADADLDGKGDACDFCPELANPDSPCPPGAALEVSVGELRSGAVGAGARVQLRRVVVTGVWESGLYVQDPSAGPANSGVAVFLGRRPGVAVGREVVVVGEVSDYFGELQLVAEDVSDVGAGAPIVPAAVSLAVAASEAYEGVLVTVDGTVTNTDYDCRVDGSGCADTGLWEIGGAGGVLVFDRAYSGSDWTARKGVTPVTGVMTFRWERRRIMPRTTDDFGS